MMIEFKCLTSAARCKGSHVRRLFALAGALVCIEVAHADEVAPACFDELAAFAAARGLAYDAADIRFSERWAGGGHEVQRVPGVRARLPVAACGDVLVVDLAPNCQVVKSWGEGACKGDYPVDIE